MSQSNRGGALIRAGVKAQGIRVAHELHTWHSSPDFVQVARGYGLAGTRVRNPAGLKRALVRGLNAPRPMLIEALIEPDAELPASDRYLHLSAATEFGS
jgi:thiamine pyrophosphate-dependent acetolactate synthase large subunit-like protein